MIFLPEIRLKRVTDILLKFLRENLIQNINNDKENQSYLYLLFHKGFDDETSSINYEEAKKIFLRKESDSRYLKVSPIFDRRRASLPTVHIVVPQDSEMLRQIGDSVGESYIEEEFQIEKVGRAFQTQFQLITTSDNINEVLYINYILRALFIGAIPLLESVGFIKPEFSTQDLNLSSDIFPANAYMKGILMSAIYPEIIPELGTKENIQNIYFNIDKIIY